MRQGFLQEALTMHQFAPPPNREADWHHHREPHLYHHGAVPALRAEIISASLEV